MSNCIENPALKKQTLEEYKLGELEKTVQELQKRITQLEAARDE